MMPIQSAPITERTSWPTLLTIGMMFMAQTFPAGFATALMPTLYRERGLPLEYFWLFSLAIIPYWLRWAIGPVVDAWWSSRIGRRRSWFIPCTLAAVAAYASLALFAPTLANLGIIVAILFVKSIFTATQEVAIDAYVVDNVRPAQRPRAAAINIVCEAVGQLAALTGLGMVYARFGWQPAVVLAALLMLLFLLPGFIRREPVSAEQIADARAVRNGSLGTLLRPLAIFLRRRDSRIVVPLMIAGGFYSGSMYSLTGPFLVDLGFKTGQIGAMVGIILLGATLAGSTIAAWGCTRLGTGRVMGLLMVAIVPATLPILLASARAWALTAPVAVFFMFLPTFVMAIFYVTLVNLRLGFAAPSQAGTDYAVGASFSRIGQTLAGGIGALIAARFTWAGFFVFSMLVGLTAIAIAWRTSDRLKSMIEERNAREAVLIVPAV